MRDKMEPEVNQEQIKAADAEGQTTFDTLFFIALDDLDCSVILYHREHYPQSVFYLQQAVEKAVKSVGLLFEMISQKDLLKNVGHNPLKVYRKPVNKFSEDLMDLNKNIESYPEFKEIMNLSGINFDEFVSGIKKGTHEFNEYINTIADYNLTKDELEEYITKIENLNRQIENTDKQINEQEISDEKFAVIKEELKNNLESAFVSLEIPDKLKEQMRNELKLIFDSFFPKKEIFEFICYFMIKAMGTGANLFYLSIITSLHSSKSRYPEENFNPLTFYTPECPLIKKMPEIQDITRQTLEEMDILYDLMFNPPIDFPGFPNYPQLTAENPGDET